MQASSSDEYHDSDDNDASSQSEAEQDEGGNEDEETLLPLEQRLKRNERKGALVRRSKPSLAAKKKKSKHAPTEVSSKRRAYFDLSANGNSISLATYKPRDPRASSLSGHLTEDKFEDNYQFVEEMRQNEIQEVKKRIQAHKLTGKKGRERRKRLGMQHQEHSLEDDMNLLQRLQTESRNLERRQMERTAQQTVKREFGPHFKPKQRDLKEALRNARLDELRKRKGESAVQKSLAKRRKREKSKDASMKIK